MFGEPRKKKKNKPQQATILEGCKLFPKVTLGMRAGPQQISEPGPLHGLPKGNSKWDKSK